MSSPKPPDIQIWLAECDTIAKRDEIVGNCGKIEGCEVIFVGKTDDGKPIVIHSSSGKAIDTPEVKFHGNRQHPNEPRTEQLAAWSIKAYVGITTRKS